MKKDVIVVLVLFLVLLITKSNTVSAIGISPDSIRINFEPNFEETYTFQTVRAENAAVYIEGALAEYVTVEKNNINKDGTFIIKVKLPANIETPGDNVLFVGITESSSGGGMVTTKASIRTPIVVRVPYPGVYAEISFNTHNLNINETASFAVIINNLGKKDIGNAKAAIDIFDINKKLVENLFTEEKAVKMKNREKLLAFFNASKHTVGVYKAIAHVNYADRSKDLESSFRIGDLNVKIINYTKKFFKDEIVNFDIEIESGWNDKIENIFAEVNVFNGTKEVSSFKTISIGLKPWERKITNTFWDTHGLGEGTYDAKITLFYEDKQTRVDGKIDIILPEEETSFLKKYFNSTNLLVVAVILLIIINIIVLIKKRKK